MTACGCPHPGDKWHLDEVFVKINGITHYLWRAVDQHGNVLDVLVQSRRTPKQPSGSSVNCSRACGMCHVCW
jgi:DDE domain